MNEFLVTQTPLSGLNVVQRKPKRDSRGFLCRMFCSEELVAAGWAGPIAQINQTGTLRRGTVRGMHFQYPPHVEAKLVTCVRGAIFDVAVDIRRSSPTFLHWHGEYLSGENARALLIPVGFAHGFQTLEDSCELNYLHSCAYAPHSEGALNAADPRLSIAWPEPIGEMSPRDAAHPFIGGHFAGIELGANA